MKKKYEEPNLLRIQFANEDVISTSPETPGGDDDDLDIGEWDPDM